MAMQMENLGEKTLEDLHNEITEKKCAFKNFCDRRIKFFKDGDGKDGF